MYHGYCKSCFYPAVDEEWALGRLLINPSNCFCGLWSYFGTVLNYVGNFTFKLNLLPLLFTQTWFVITLFRTLMMELYLRTLCNMRHVRWIMYDLGCLWIVYRDPSWYLTDYRVYMGSSMTVRPLTGRHCTCVLINWSVLRQKMKGDEYILQKKFNET